MDLNRIFMKNATPTKIGGQAIMEGIMMRGPKRIATVVRLPDHSLHLKVEPVKKPSKWSKVPIIRGCISFFGSLVTGTKILMYSADVLEAYEGPGAYIPDADEQEPDWLSEWLEKHIGADATWNIMLYMSMVFSLIFTIALFILLPTVVVNWCDAFTQNAIILNFIEGLIRIGLFIGYVALIRLMEDIRRVFQFHGAEHKTIHCYENHLELTPENADQFYTLHPRCGTSFMMFVMVLTVLVYACFGWPSLFWRFTSRLLLLPLIAGGSYELLRLAGRSNSTFVKAISLPGIYLQKLTTCEPDYEHLEVAIAAMHAAEGDEEGEFYEGPCDLQGRPCTHEQSLKDALTGALGVGALDEIIDFYGYSSLR